MDAALHLVLPIGGHVISALASGFADLREATGTERVANVHGLVYGLAPFPGRLEDGVLAAAEAAVLRRAVVMDTGTKPSSSLEGLTGMEHPTARNRGFGA